MTPDTNPDPVKALLEAADEARRYVLSFPPGPVREWRMYEIDLAVAWYRENLK